MRYDTRRLSTVYFANFVVFKIGSIRGAIIKKNEKNWEKFPKGEGGQNKKNKVSISKMSEIQKSLKYMRGGRGQA